MLRRMCRVTRIRNAKESGDNKIGRCEWKYKGGVKRGRPKRRWLDHVKDDIRVKGCLGRRKYTWRHISSHSSGIKMKRTETIV